MNLLKVYYLLLLLIPIIGQAQESVLGIPPFTFEPGKVTSSEAHQLYGEVVSEIMNISPIPVVARESAWGYVSKERKLQEGDDFADASIIAQGQALSATRLLVGHILNIDKENFGAANPIIHLCVLDVNSGQIIYSSVVSKIENKQLSISNVANQGIFSASNEMTSLLKGVTQAINAMKINKKDALALVIRDFFNECFPPQYPIMALEETKGNSRAISFIFTGKTSLFQKGQALEVIQWTAINQANGNSINRRSVLAQAKVAAIEGDVIVCRVRKKAEQEVVFSKYQENGVYVTTKSGK